MKIKSDVLYEAEKCVPIFQNLWEELCREIKYNNRKNKGNESAPVLFSIIWNNFCGSSPLCTMALELNVLIVDDPILIGKEEFEKIVMVGINRVDETLKKNVNGPNEARDIVHELKDRVYDLVKVFGSHNGG